MNRHGALLAALAALFVSPATLAQGNDPGAPDFYAIVDARIVPVRGKPIEKGTLVLKDGLIAAVGERVTPPPGARVIPGKGLTLYPGLIDADTRLGMPAPADYPAAVRGDAYPVPAVRAENAALALFKADPAAAAARRSAGFGAALAAPYVGLFAGTSALLSLAPGDDPAALALRPSVWMHLQVGVSDPAGGYPGSLMGGIAAARQALYDAGYAARQADRYAREPEGRPRPRLSRALGALRPVVEKKLPLAVRASGAREIQRALRLAAEFGLTPVIQGGTEASAVADALKKAGASVLLSVDLPEAPRVAPGEESPETLQGMRRRALAPAAAARLAAAGIPFALTTAGLADPTAFSRSVRRLIAAGLSEDDAVAAVTWTPARLLGVDRQLGSLEPGKIGNVVAVEGGTLFAPSAKVRHLFIDGKRVALDAPAASAEEKREAPPTVGTGLVPPLPPALPSTFVLRGATVWTSGPQGVLAGADVFVRDGKIAAVGRELAVPRGTREIDARGKHVTPGLIDCHSHTAIEGSVNEGTNSVTAECRIQDVLDPDDVNIYRQLAGGTTAANVLHGSANAIGGQSAVVKWRWGKDAEGLRLDGAPEGIKFALGENPTRSNGGFTPGRARYPSTRMGVERVIRAAFLEARAYAARWKAFRAGKGPEPRRDLQLDALVEVLDGKRRVHCHCYRADEILMMTRLAEEFGFRMATFQHVLEGYKVADELARHGAGASTFSDWWGFKIEAYDAIPHNAALLSERGVTVSLNSDSSELARRLNGEAAKAVRYGGMKPEEALKLVTIHPAWQLGVEKRIGSLEPGKDADLALWSGDPLSTRTVCEKTFVDGQLYFDREADHAARGALDEEKRRLARSPAPAAPAPSPAAAVSAPAPPAAAVSGPVTALVGGTVHPVSAPAIPEGVVVLQGGKIVAVGAVGQVSIPEGAARIDCTGRHLYPGLIDADTTLGVNEIGSRRETQDFREQGEFSPELLIAHVVNPDAETIRVARSAGVLSAVVAPAGGTIAGTAALLNLEGWSWEEMAIAPAVGLSVAFPATGGRRLRETTHRCEEASGADDDPAEGDAAFKGNAFVPAGSRDQDALLYGWLPFTAQGAPPPSPRPAASDALRSLTEFVDTARRYREAASAAPGTPTDRCLEAMGPVLEGKVPLLVRADRAVDIRAAVAWAKREGLRLLLVGGREADRCADLLVAEKVPVLLGSTLTLPSRADAPYDEAYTLPARLAKAGVSFCLSTGSASNVRYLPQIAAVAAAYGLDPDEALRAITQRPAEILGVGARLGTIEPGKDATLIVATGDVLELTSDIVAAYVCGQPLDLSNRQTRLFARWRSRPRR